MSLSRRQLLLRLSAAFLAACSRAPSAEESTMSAKMPSIFLPHGGGPWPFMDLSRFGGQAMYAGLTRYLEGLATLAPKAIVVISAHWEEAAPTVMSAPRPPMFYDYYGFPAETYTLQWPAPGEPALAERVRAALVDGGFNAQEDRERGFDHGTFIPLMITWPEPTIPVVQLSLKRGLDPAEHLAMGRALAPLRDEGVLVIGSGMSYHNMKGFFGHVTSIEEDSRRFDDWLAEAVQAPAAARDSALAQWSRAPRARACHPREEHLLPLMIAAGAAGEGAGSTPYRDQLMGARVLAAHFA